MSPFWAAIGGDARLAEERRPARLYGELSRFHCEMFDKISNTPRT
jgi:hypothetical protein